jgi:hypothetical protein
LHQAQGSKCRSGFQQTEIDIASARGGVSGQAIFLGGKSFRSHMTPFPHFSQVKKLLAIKTLLAN